MSDFISGVDYAHPDAVYKATATGGAWDGERGLCISLQHTRTSTRPKSTQQIFLDLRGAAFLRDMLSQYLEEYAVDGYVPQPEEPPDELTD